MQPLTPKDLIIRPASPGNEDKPKPVQVVGLERHQELEHQLKDTPLYVDPYLELAAYYLGVKRWTDARRVMEVAVHRFPDDPRAASLLEDAQLGRSRELLDRATQEHKQESTILTEDSVRRCQLELNAMIERVYRARLHREPERVELMLPLAEALERLEQSDQAMSLLKQASQYPRLRAAASLQLGRILERAMRVPEALSAYRRAAVFRVPPPSPEIQRTALNAAADLAERSGMVDSARRYVAMLLGLSPGNQPLMARLEELKKLPL